MTSNAQSCDVIAEALKRYNDVIFGYSRRHRNSLYHTGPVLPGLTVHVENFEGQDCQYPGHLSDEKYTLAVYDTGAFLTSTTVWGALRGLETFSQLVHSEMNEPYKFLINVTEVEDFPRFGFRGILLDSARHFLSVDVIKRNLDGMAYNKFNVFHWHVVDDQSWPLQLCTFPNITASAFSPRSVYTKSDVQDIIEYARLRGIRVIPEIDTPGHTQALGKALPDLLARCSGEGKKDRLPALDPTKEHTYRTVVKILKEVADTFKDQFIHLGMDEVNYACWRQNPDIQYFMKEQGLSSLSEVEGYYVHRLLQDLRSFGSKYMIWQDPIDNGVEVPRDTIVGVWKNSAHDKWQGHATRVARKGYQIVVSGCWYLNYISYGDDWKKYYECDPTSFSRGENMKDLVIGGEAAMWGEYIDDTNLVATLWPRACAVAERLWSSATYNNANDASHRLHQQRCRMLRRGIQAQPIGNSVCPEYVTSQERQDTCRYF
ncbi:beta-hexosaminidase subunit beta-like [Ornithodoros turicata]|uniref:beta-hexosaminidase subunit beta-like n=1 Tax=Ornithodoros turicata TaxID=34597 RepID=UPI0031388CE5